MKACHVAWKHPARFSARRCASSMAARHKIHIEHLPINPHTDIMPCNEYRIEVRTIERWVPKAKDPSGRTVQYEAACIYGPDGRCVQEVSPSRG